MSNLISAAVQRRVVGSATRKAVLLYMADKAADDGSGIWSSKGNIARDLELGIRAVQYAIRDLVTAGLLIEIGQRDCKHGYTVEYGIVIDAVGALHSTRDAPSEQRGSTAKTPVDKSSSSPASGAPHALQAGVTPAPDAPLPLHHVHPNHPYNLTTTLSGNSTPVDNSDPPARCLAAGGPGLCPASRNAIVATADVIREWLNDGIELDADILPVIARRTSHIRISPIRTWAYFTDAVRTAHRARLRQPAALKGTEKPETAKPGAGTPPKLRFYADWVNSERYLPPSAITNAIAYALLAAGLVSPERMRLRSIPVTTGKDRR